MPVYSEVTLGLRPRWFTGKEWANGTAQRELTFEYKKATRNEAGRHLGGLRNQTPDRGLFDQ